MRYWVLVVALSCATVHGSAQLASRADDSRPASQPALHRTRLILKDGSYQVVTSYKVAGARVEYVSAERGGEIEEIPLKLVDLEATQKWERDRVLVDPNTPPSAQRPAPILDPELAKEEAERASLTPEVAPNLHLAFEDSVLALDEFHGGPELVPLQQAQGDLNRQTGHSILRGVIRPNSSAHQLLTLIGEKADVQMHVPDPTFYIRSDQDAPPDGEALTVNTHGASSSPALKEKPAGPRHYALIRVDVRQGARVVASFNTAPDGTAQREVGQQDVVDTNSVVLAGGHWTKISPKEPLLFGEYCLVEILGDHQVNLSVWDFGIHPTAPENRDVLRPEKKRPGALERRKPGTSE